MKCSELTVNIVCATNMDITRLLFLACIICSATFGVVVGEEEDGGMGDMDEELADFPLDDPGGATDRMDAEEAQGQGLNELEDIDLSELETTEGNRQELLRKVMAAAMAKPGARQRLAQVMPILRTMSATQRLALAGLVTSQLMAPPGAPPPPPLINSSNSNLTDDLMIPISMDIAAMFRGLGRDANAARSNLFRGDLYKRHPPYRRRPLQSLNRRNTEVPNDDMKPPPRVKLPRRPGGSKLQMGRPLPPPALVPDVEAGTDCQLFSDSLCLQVGDYPMEAILKSIQSTPNKNAFEALRMDAKQDFGEMFNEAGPKMERRQGQQEPQSLCSSKVEIARPKRARATSGQWKYVVNTGDYTQTLRLEMCIKPQQSCLYLADNFKSECTQVYNYHRLLTWDHKSGLTMDIFKVPTCCSCNIQGVSHPFLGAQRPEASGVEPQRHPDPSQPPPPPRANYAEAPETNFVAAEDTQAVHRLPPPKQILTRRPVGGLHNIPKRESLPTRLQPPRAPPLVLADPPGDHIRYPVAHPPYENLLRRTISRNNTELNEIRPKYHPVQPTLNQRHPELPVDSLLSDNTFSFVTSAPDYQTPPRTYQTSTPRRGPVTYTSTAAPPLLTTQRMLSTTLQTQGSSKRVNYSYHPIIDFFKTSVSAESRVAHEGVNSADWTPITDGPRLMPK